MSADVNIRHAETADATGIWALIRELAIYELAPDEHTVSVDQLRQDLTDGKFRAFVADMGDARLAGMALFFPVYSTWKGEGFYLEDIIVTETHRRQGIGSQLFEAVADHAREHNASRLSWQVLDWNTPAIEFYKKYDAAFLGEWLNCRLTREQLKAGKQTI